MAALRIKQVPDYGSLGKWYLECDVCGSQLPVQISNLAKQINTPWFPCCGQQRVLVEQKIDPAKAGENERK